MKKMNEQVKANAVTGASAGVGAAAGVMLGGLVNPVNAANRNYNEDDEDDESTVPPVAGENAEETVQPEDGEQTIRNEEEIVLPEEDMVLPEEEDVDPEEDDIVVIDEEPDIQEPEEDVIVSEEPAEVELAPGVNVEAYGTLTDGQGNEVDVVYLNAQGQGVAVFDEDQDGRADYAVADLNHDGVISSDEVEVLDEIYVDMAQLQQAAHQAQPDEPADDMIGMPDVTENEILAQQTGADPDFVNDANMDSYYA